MPPNVESIASACILLACKYLESTKPGVEDLTAGLMTVDEFLKLELDILAALNWDLYVPTPHAFVTLHLAGLATEVEVGGARLDKAMVGKLTRAAIFFVDLSAFEHHLLEKSPSEVAVSALCCACQQRDAGTQWARAKIEGDPAIASCVQGVWEACRKSMPTDMISPPPDTALPAVLPAASAAPCESPVQEAAVLLVDLPTEYPKASSAGDAKPAAGAASQTSPGATWRHLAAADALTTTVVPPPPTTTLPRGKDCLNRSVSIDSVSTVEFSEPPPFKRQRSVSPVAALAF